MITEEERKEAIKRLQDNKNKSSRYDLFGYDNHAAIDIAIRVIKEDMSQDLINKTWDGETDESENLWLSAIGARNFLDGECQLSDILYPEKPIMI